MSTLSAALLLATAGTAAAATKKLSGTLEGLGGNKFGTISMKANVKKGVVRSISGVKISKLKPTCVFGGQAEAGPPITGKFKGSFKVKKRKHLGKSVYRFEKSNASGAGFKWLFSGNLNKNGTRLTAGRLSSSDTGGQGSCGVSTTFSAK